MRIDDEDRPQPHQRRRRGGWRGFAATLPAWFDSGAYDDILVTIRRQGFFDPLGCDLLPAEYDNGEWMLIRENGEQIYANGTLKWSARHDKRAVQQQEAYELEQRRRQEERERISTIQWQQAIAQDSLSQRLAAGVIERECLRSWEYAARQHHLETGSVAWLGRRDESQPGYHQSWLTYMRWEIDRHKPR